jgi:predicted anti-sigma-YlaC factor YlaD
MGLSCRQIVELVTDYFEDKLEPATREAVEEHLGDCPYCVNYLVQMRETIRLTGLLCEDDLPPHVREELIHAFRAWRAG